MSNLIRGASAACRLARLMVTLSLAALLSGCAAIVSPATPRPQTATGGAPSPARPAAGQWSGQPAVSFVITDDGRLIRFKMNAPFGAPNQTCTVESAEIAQRADGQFSIGAAADAPIRVTGKFTGPKTAVGTFRIAACPGSENSAAGARRRRETMERGMGRGRAGRQRGEAAVKRPFGLAHDNEHPVARGALCHAGRHPSADNPHTDRDPFIDALAGRSHPREVRRDPDRGRRCRFRQQHHLAGAAAWRRCIDHPGRSGNRAHQLGGRRVRHGDTPAARCTYRRGQISAGRSDLCQRVL